MRTMIEGLMTRQVNARTRLVECLAETGEISTADAENVATLYLSREFRAVELGANDGQFRIRGANGDLFERSPIRTAVAMIKAGQFPNVKFTSPVEG